MILTFLYFKQLLEDWKKPQPTFVSVKPDSASINEIYGLMDRIRLPGKDRVVPSELHATVAYSRDPIHDPSRDVRDFLPIEADGDELTVFYSRNEGKRVLVLKLTSLRLRALHHLIRKHYGASYDFPTYEPHVTLCYDLPEGFDFPKRIDPIPINFTEFESKKLDLDWKPT